MVVSSQHLLTTLPIQIIEDYDHGLLCIEVLRITEIIYVKYLDHLEPAMLKASQRPPSAWGRMWHFVGGSNGTPAVAAGVLQLATARVPSKCDLSWSLVASGGYSEELLKVSECRFKFFGQSQKWCLRPWKAFIIIVGTKNCATLIVKIVTRNLYDCGLWLVPWQLMPSTRTDVQSTCKLFITRTTNEQLHP